MENKLTDREVQTKNEEIA